MTAKVLRESFLDELQKIAASSSRYTVANSRSGRRPMRVDTFLKKEKEGTLFKDTPHFENRRDHTGFTVPEMVDRTDATTKMSSATYEEAVVAAFQDELRKIAHPAGLSLADHPDAVLELVKSAGIGDMFRAGVGAVGGLGARAAGGLKQVGQAAVGGLQRGMGAVGQAARGAASSVGGLAQRAATGVGNAVQGAAGAVKNTAQNVAGSINKNVIKPMGEGFQHAYHQGSHGMLGNALSKPFGQAGRVAGGVIRAGINPIGTAAEGLVAHHGKNLAQARGWAPGTLKHNLATKVAPVAAEVLGGAGVGTALHTPVSMAGALGHKALAGVGHLAPAIEHGLHAVGDFGHHLVSDVVGGKLQGMAGRIGGLAQRFRGGAAQAGHSLVPPPMGH